jgi:hypothetical protein
MNATKSATAVRIKADFGYYYGTFNAPQDGYLMGEPQYDYRTGREYSEPLEFASVAEAFAYLTKGSHGCYPSEVLACDYDGDGDFSVSGTYYTFHGQHSRPVYTIVSRKSGRCTKAIKAECDRINDNA